MPSKNDQPRFKWREMALPGPTNKKVWRMLKMHPRALKQAKQLAEATYLLGE